MKLKYLTPTAVSLIPLLSFGVFFGTYLLYLNSFGINLIPAEIEQITKTLSISEPSTEVPEITLPYVNDAIFRIIWSIFSLTLVCVVFYSASFSIYTIYRGTLSLAKKSRGITYVLIAIAFVATWFLVKKLPMSGGLGALLYDVSEENTNPPLAAQDIMDITMANVVATIVLVVAACCAMTFKSLQSTRANQTDNFGLFQQNLIVTALLLSTGIMHIFSLYKWQTTFIGLKPEADLILSGMTLSVSVFFTLCFAMIYLPTYMVIRRSAFNWAKSSSKAENNEEVLKYMEERGLSFGLKNVLNLVSLIASPLIVGILTEFAKI